MPPHTSPGGHACQHASNRRQSWPTSHHQQQHSHGAAHSILHCISLGRLLVGLDIVQDLLPTHCTETLCIRTGMTVLAVLNMHAWRAVMVKGGGVSTQG